jgi:hypothetical protein
LARREPGRLVLVLVVDGHNAEICARSRVSWLWRFITRYDAISVSLQIEEHVTDGKRELSFWTRGGGAG